MKSFLPRDYAMLLEVVAAKFRDGTDYETFQDSDHPTLNRLAKQGLIRLSEDSAELTEKGVRWLVANEIVPLALIPCLIERPAVLTTHEERAEWHVLALRLQTSKLSRDWLKEYAARGYRRKADTADSD